MNRSTVKPKPLPSPAPVPATVTKVVGRLIRESEVKVKNKKTGEVRVKKHAYDFGSYCETTETKTGTVHMHMNGMVNEVPPALRKVGSKGYNYWKGHTQFAFFRKDK